jgi:hypothetical protein
MRKVIYSMNVTLDGCIAGPDDEAQDCKSLPNRSC